jgi:nitroimidazol reductase NimA-like FMN-containing flavoprotein (pyridoxamine 5'-phosphate oxidase superfamily)
MKKLKIPLGKLSTEDRKMIEKMKKIVMDEKYCVLATAMNNKPYCSLMAYAVEDDCSKIYMVTKKDSEKYKNLKSNKLVSLLIDTRASTNEKSAKALTISGSFSMINDKKILADVKNKLRNRHPDLEIFLINDSSCIFAIEIKSFLLLDGFTDSYLEYL